MSRLHIVPAGAAIALAVFMVPNVQGARPTTATSRPSAEAAQAALDEAFLQGKAFDSRGRPAEAAAQFERALRIAEQIHGKDDPVTGGILSWLAGSRMALGQYAKAEPLLLRSLAITEAKLGKDHPSVAASLNGLAELYFRTVQYAKAEPLHLRALAITEAKLGKDHPNVATSLYGLAELYQAMGQYAKAEPLYLRALAIDEAKLGKDHPDVAMSLRNLAGLYQDMGRYTEAEPLFLRSLAIWEAKLGKDHPSLGIILNGLAGLYWDMGQYAKAEALYRRDLAFSERTLGKDHPEVATCLCNLGLLYYAMGAYAKAEPLLLRSLAIRETKLGKGHPSLASSLSSLALLYHAMGAYAKAEPLYLRSLGIMETALGKDHPDSGGILDGLSGLYWDMGQYAKAEALVLRSLAIREAKLDKDHPDLAVSLGNLACLYILGGQPAKAWPLLERSRKVLEHARIRASGSSLARSSYFGEHTTGDLAPCLALRLRKDVDVLQLMDSQQALGLRELLVEAKLEAETVLNKVDGRKVALALGRINALNAAIEKRAGLGQPAGELRDELSRAERDYDALMAELRKGHEQYVATETAEGISSEQAVQSPTLDDQTAIVGWVEFAAKKWLWGYVIRTGGVHWVDLSNGYDPATEGEMRQRVLASVRGAGQEGGTPAARDLAAFYHCRFGPLEPYLKSVRKLIVIAQNWTAHLPVEMLLTIEPAEGAPMSDWPWLGAKYRVSYAPSVTTLDILCRQRTKRKDRQWSRPLLALADPPFSEEQLAAMKTEQGTPAGVLVAAADGDVEALLERAVRFDPTVVPSRLPGTRREAQLIAAVCGADRSLLLLGPEGSERRLFAASRSGELGKCRYVHLATHGYADAERPELSGLVLARVPADPNYDGVLHMREVFHLKLQADLVVLSACQTGLGRDLRSEGVVGLSTAFFFAGTPSLVMSLWNVPDAPTALLMQRFYRNLAVGQTKAAALQEAKTWLRNLTREDLAKLGRADPQIAQLTRSIGGSPTTSPKGRRIEDRPFAHPHCWAGFILTGDPE